MTQLPEYMVTHPTVFAVGNKYDIFVPFSEEVIMWVNVGGNTYYDHANGILRSNTLLHKVEIPMEVLDDAKEYTVVYKRMLDRKPYFPVSEDERSVTVRFRPVPAEGDVNIYNIADAHNMEEEPIAAGKFFGDKINLLVLNGDIPNHSGDIKNFNSIYKIAAEITNGECPCIFARGNHDTRGIRAEEIHNYIPVKDGKTYYTFRVGSVWGMVLDCGEDKPDDHPEYGGTICFHRFREEQTDFIKNVIADADKEFNAPGVKHKLIISHMAFTRDYPSPFDIEYPLYEEWSRLLKEGVAPDLILNGHLHYVDICPVGSYWDNRGQPCPVIITSKPTFAYRNDGVSGFVGTGVVLSDDGKQRVLFTNEKGEVERDEYV